MPQQIHDRFIRIKGLRINYVKIGEGKKNLIVLPGGAGPVHFYLWIINARLAREYTAYFLNPPGFGRSNPAPQPKSKTVSASFNSTKAKGLFAPVNDSVID